MTEPRTRAELIAEFFARRPITAAAPPAPPGKLPDGADAPPAKPAPTDPDAKAAVSADADVTTALATVRTAVEAAIAAQAKDPEATTDPNDQKVNTDLQALLAALEAVETSQAADSDAGPQPKTPPAPAKPAPKAPFPPKAAPPVAAASNRFAGPVTPVGDTPPPVQQGGTNAGASGDVDPAALCKDCGHLAASHADTAEGANTGACAMNGCACASTVVPDGENLDGPPDNPGQTPSGQLAISQAERDAAAKAGTAMPDGSYPVRNPGELDKAISAVGRGGADHDKIRRHVIKRAKALGSPGKIPDNWNGDGSLKSAAQGRVTTTVIRPDGTIEHRSAFEDLAPLDPNLDLPKLLAPVAAVAPAPVAEGAAPPETSTTDQTAPMLPGGQAIGAAFTIPVGIIEGLQTSDGRMIQPNALTWREPPLPLMAMLTSSHGNDSMADAAVLVGRVESIARDGANITAAGHLLTNKDAIQFATDLEQMGQFGVSADVGDVTSIESMPEPVVSPQGVMTFDPAAMPIETLTSGTLMGFTACPFPAFPGCYIILGDGQDTEPIPMKAPTADQARIGLHVLTTEECEPCAAGVESIAASASPLAPPLAWFETPEPDELTPLTVFEDGRVFGHLAGWSQCHVGRGGCLTPPADRAGYAYFLTGYVLCADGSEVPTGTITIDAMHAPGSFSLQAAMAHYDNTATGVAAVTIKNGKIGPWYCGAMFPGATAEQFHRLRANPPSGDWRPLGRGQHALCAMLAVNSQGFPIPRATVKNGKMLSLVAAGAPEMYALAHPEVPLTEEQRMERIESMMSHLAPMAVAGLRARFQRARGR